MNPGVAAVVADLEPGAAFGAEGFEDRAPSDGANDSVAGAWSGADVESAGSDFGASSGGYDGNKERCDEGEELVCFRSHSLPFPSFLRLD